MKNLLVLFVVSLLLFSCKKDNVQHTVYHAVYADVKFTAPFMGNLFLSNIDSVFIEVDGQVKHSFKTYLHQCNSKSVGYVISTNKDIDLAKYTIYTEGGVIEKGTLVFREWDEKHQLIK